MERDLPLSDCFLSWGINRRHSKGTVLIKGFKVIFSQRLILFVVAGACKKFSTGDRKNKGEETYI